MAWQATYGIAGWLLLFCGTSVAVAQCDPPPPPPPPPGGGVVLYSLNGQTVQADPSGSFLISNVASPDVAPEDFLGDDFLRITGVRTTGPDRQELLRQQLLCGTMLPEHRRMLPGDR